MGVTTSSRPLEANSRECSSLLLSNGWLGGAVARPSGLSAAKQSCLESDDLAFAGSDLAGHVIARK